MRRIKITVAYDGTDFHGWQVQPNLPTIQAAIQDVVSGIEGSPVHVTGSGRTDAGVHALAQVAAFNIVNPIPALNLRKAMNRLLPSSIRVIQVEEVNASFHPRYDAVAKTYEYRIFRGETRPPFDRLYVLHHPYPIDEDKLIGLAPLFEGEHDFTPFAAADERDAAGFSKVRTIFSSRAERSGDLLLYRVRGSGFLKHMVRNLVGTLIEGAKGNIRPEEMLLRSGQTAAAQGLFLLSVEY